MNKRETIASLHRLINHPATPEAEREAARAALLRILGNRPKTKVSVARLFSNKMSTLR